MKSMNGSRFDRISICRCSRRYLCQMCFSSQYYMMMTVHVNGIVYFVLGVQMMIRKVCGIGLRHECTSARENETVLN